MMKVTVLNILCVSCLMLSACKSPNKPNNEVVGLSRDDSTFLALKDTAQYYYPMLSDSMKAHLADTANYTFLVKSDYVDHDVHEHMWSRVYQDNGTTLSTVLIDSPYNVKAFHTLDKVTVKPKDVEDWAIYDYLHKQEYGGFSTKYLESKLKK